MAIVKIISNVFVSNLAEVLTQEIEIGTKIWQFCVILENALIGNNCNVCWHYFIENNVFIGNNVTVNKGNL